MISASYFNPGLNFILHYEDLFVFITLELSFHHTWVHSAICCVHVISTGQEVILSLIREFFSCVLFHPNQKGGLQLITQSHTVLM